MSDDKQRKRQREEARKSKIRRDEFSSDDAIRAIRNDQIEQDAPDLEKDLVTKQALAKRDQTFERDAEEAYWSREQLRIRRKGHPGDAREYTTLSDEPLYSEIHRQLSTELANLFPFVSPENKNKALMLYDVLKKTLREKELHPLESLDLIVSACNDVYDLLDFNTIYDENNVKLLMEKQSWQTKLVDSLFRERDRLLSLDQDAVKYYSLTSQYGRLNPGTPAPEVIRQLDEFLDTFLFNPQLPNDCGRFARHLERKLMSYVLPDLLAQTSRYSTLSLPALNNFLRSDVLKSFSKVEVKYREDAGLSYGYHWKTMLSAKDSQVITLEANVGSPFLLAPELLVYDSESAVMEVGEFSDETISDRIRTPLSSSIVLNFTQTDGRGDDSKRYDQLLRLMEKSRSGVVVEDMISLLGYVKSELGF